MISIELINSIDEEKYSEGCQIFRGKAAIGLLNQINKGRAFLAFCLFIKRRLVIIPVIIPIVSLLMINVIRDVQFMAITYLFNGLGKAFLDELWLLQQYGIEQPPQEAFL